MIHTPSTRNLYVCSPCGMRRVSEKKAAAMARASGERVGEGEMEEGGHMR